MVKDWHTDHTYTHTQDKGRKEGGKGEKEEEVVGCGWDWLVMGGELMGR